MNLKDLNWLNNARQYGGSFIKAFAECALYADQDNLELLWPILKTLQTKYSYYHDKEKEN